jgi:ATP-dependent Clp protease ATP-binding subunit ClpC
MGAHRLSDPRCQALARDRCTTKAIDALLATLKQADDGTRLLNHPLTECLVLLTLLRSEINVAQAVLANMNVDVHGLAARLEGLLDQHDQAASRPEGHAADDLAHFRREAAATVRDLVERGKQEAAVLGHDYVGTEHLLLAIIRTNDSSLSPVLAHSGITYGAARHAVRKVLCSRPPVG